MSSTTTRTAKTGATLRVPVAKPTWKGREKRLDTGEVTEFSEFLPLRPRGAQVILDPFVPDEQVAITGRVVSPAKELDPGATPEVWIDGQPVTLDGSGAFQATVQIHEGRDQVTFRAVDATKLEGRGYVSTWRPSADASDTDEPATARPARHGRTRAAIQQLAVVPAVPALSSLDLVLKGGDGSELGRITLSLTHGDDESTADWFCVTATDSRQGAPALPAVEGKILRAPGVHAALEVELDGAPLGDPIRLSGWDASTRPTPLASFAPDAAPSVAVGGRLGGRFDAGDVSLSWMVDADADGVPLPGDRGHSPARSLEGSIAAKAEALASPDPVELADEVTFPHGWALLHLEGTEADGWEHDESFHVLTYATVPADSTDRFGDFVFTANRDRVQWPDEDGTPYHPDQVFVAMKSDSTDGDVIALCAKFGLHVVGAIGRDRHFTLESDEPLERAELEDLATRVSSETGVDSAHPNWIVFPHAVPIQVASVRPHDYLRAAHTGATQGPGMHVLPGCLGDTDIDVVAPYMQMRALPAQALIERLLAESTGDLPVVSVAVVDTGFGNGTPNVSPDFSASRFPHTTAGAPAGILAAGTGNAASLEVLHALAGADMRDNDIDHGRGHGTTSLHAVGGSGVPAREGRPTPPAPTTPPAFDTTSEGGATMRTAAFCLGTAPSVALFPIKAARHDDWGSSWSRIGLAIRNALQRPEVQVVNMSFGTAPGHVANAQEKQQARTEMGPAFDAAKAAGKVVVLAINEKHNVAVGAVHQTSQCVFDFMTPTAARTENDWPLVAVSATKVSRFDSTGATPGDSRETKTDWAYYGAEVTVAAPGESLYLRTATGGLSHYGQVEQATTQGTSFSAPFVSGLFGNLFLADKLAGRSRSGMAFANKLIDLVAYTARKGALLMGAAETLRSDYVGHGSIDCWAALLSVLNDGPLLLAGQQKHANLTNTGESVPAANVVWYGFEIETSAIRAKPWLVNCDTGAWAPLADDLSLDPACDATASDHRAIWAWQNRVKISDRVLPLDKYPDEDPAVAIQFSVRRAQLAGFTHLVFQRPADLPAIAAAPDRDSAGVPDPCRFFYGLPLAPLLQHDVTGTQIAPWSVELQHFIFKTRTNEHGRRIRVTVASIEILAAPSGTYALTARANGVALGGSSDAHPGGTGKTLYPGEASGALFVAVGAALDLSFQLGNLGTATASYPGFRFRAGEVPAGAPPDASPPPQAQPRGPLTPWGFGDRVVTDPAGKFRVHFRVEQEPNLPRRWRAAVSQARATRAGNFRVSISVNGVRSAWSSVLRAPNATQSFVVPFTLVGTGVVTLAPYTGGAPPTVEVRVEDTDAGTTARFAYTPTGDAFPYTFVDRDRSSTIGGLAVTWTLDSVHRDPDFQATT